jgi:hypothetical protein
MWLITSCFASTAERPSTSLRYAHLCLRPRCRQAERHAVDADGNAYVAGNGGDTDFPIAAGTFQPSYTSGRDGFITKYRDGWARNVRLP